MKNTYRGINILCLWIAQAKKDYSQSLWGTYKQWQSVGAQIQKGEKASTILFYKQIEVENQDAESKEDSKETRLMIRSSSVFNVAQVSGYTYKIPTVNKVKAIEEAKSFVGSTNAQITHGLDGAYYHPKTDTIHLPKQELFKGTSSSTPTRL